MKVVAVATAVALGKHKGEVWAQRLGNRGTLPRVVGEVREEDAAGVCRLCATVEGVGGRRVGVHSGAKHGSAALLVVGGVQAGHAEAAC